jgi:hypothetical protein
LGLSSGSALIILAISGKLHEFRVLEISFLSSLLLSSKSHIRATGYSLRKSRHSNRILQRWCPSVCLLSPDFVRGFAHSDQPLQGLCFPPRLSRFCRLAASCSHNKTKHVVGFSRHNEFRTRIVGKFPTRIASRFLSPRLLSVLAIAFSFSHQVLLLQFWTCKKESTASGRLLLVSL